MVVRNSVRQLLRTPVKTLFFFLLLACTIAFFMLGYNLWNIANRNIDKINQSYTTIGTVEQKPTSLQTGAMWNAYKKAYTYRTDAVMGSPIPISVLDFTGANYIQKPEKRPIYYAYDPNFVIDDYAGFELGFNAYNLIMEIQPVADCVPDQPVLMKVKKVLWGSLTASVDEIWFCDSSNENPAPLYADKTYIISLTTDRLYDITVGFDKTVYAPEFSVQGMQSTKEGDSIRSERVTTEWDEVTDHFFETPRGKQWQALIDSFSMYKHIVTVTPTNSTKLLMTFFTGDSRVLDGRDIRPDEYKNGDKVCLVSSYFAKNNHLAVGSRFRLPLVNADYYRSLNYGWMPASLINAKGESYSAFEDSEYTVVGIYNTAPQGSSNAFDLDQNTIVIPFASVKNSDENNIVSAGPMMEYSTSFQIPNGQIKQFMAAWQKQGNTDLDIQFYDKGYSKIMAGLDNMRSTAMILFAVGAVTTLFVVILFCHLFITKQRKRTAIERSLGMSRGRCAASMLVGMLLIVLAAYAVGFAVSAGCTALAVGGLNAGGRGPYDTSFSDWVNSVDAKASEDQSISGDGGEASGALAGSAVIPVVLFVALGNIRGNMKSEPLKLLGEKER